MIELKIDPEFRDKIPPLTDAEFEQLRENILEDGEVYEPICVWNGTIVDGHNRWKVIQERPDIPYRVKEMDFADKWAAFDWMYKKQLGRRNLTDEQRAYMIGKMYEARKKSIGEHKGNQHTVLEIDQNDPIPTDKPKSTAEAIGREVGVAEPSVKRWEKFAKGVDTLAEVSQEAADKILAGGSGVKKKDVMELVQMDKPDVEQFAEDVISGEIKSNKRKTGGGWTKKDREIRSLTEKIVADMYNPDSVPEFTLEMFIEEIQSNSKHYIDLLRSILSERSTLLTKENRPIVADTIENDVIKEIIKIKELIVS